MPSIAEIRAQNPQETAGKSNWDIVTDFAKANGVSPEVMAIRLNAELPNAPGFDTAFKNAVGTEAHWIGQVMSLLGWKNNPIVQYGQEVMQINPIGIQNASDIADDHWVSIKVGAGMLSGYILPILIIYLLLTRIRAAARRREIRCEEV